MRGTGVGKGVIPGTEDEIDLCERVWAHTKAGISFQRDEVTGDGVGGYPSDEVVETIIRPVEMAKFMDRGDAVGDCDDFENVIWRVAKRVSGYRVRLPRPQRIQGTRGSSHMCMWWCYPKSGSGMRMRFPLDASHGEYPGWETQGLGRYQEWPVLDKMSWFVGNAVMQATVVVGLILLVRYLGRFA